MENTRVSVAEWEAHGEQVSAFLGTRQPSMDDRFILVMGMTGSGKSTFISQYTNKDVSIGHGLYSCTGSINVFDSTQDGRRIYMIDTPGFNDTTRSDSEVLQTLATYLGASYANGVRIHGVIILHPISDNRMSGSGKRTIDIIKAICGFPSYRNVTIATTKWPSAPSATENAILASRESELKSNKEFFGDLVRRGATVVRVTVQGHEQGRVQLG